MWKMSYDTKEIDLIYRIAGHLADGDTLDEELATVVDFAVTVTQAEECCTFVREGNVLVPWVWKHVDHGSLNRIPVTIDEGFAAALLQHCTPVANVPHSGFRVFREWPKDPGVSFVAVPLLWRSSVMGAIVLQHGQARPYKDSELRLLSSVGYILGAELRMLQLQKHNSELVLELETRKLVERGRGILQRDLGISAQEAYQALQRQSEEKKRSLKDIARAIILNSEVRQSAAAQSH
jgi:signal transduction protein with GAF and PtsI domain